MSHSSPRPDYHYRQLADGSSLVQSSWSCPAKYTDVTRYGYLRLLEFFHEQRGFVPMWVQNLVLYDLSWFFKQDEWVHSVVGAIPSDMQSEFHEIVREIMQYIDAETIEEYRLTPISAAIRNALIIGTKRERLRPSVLNVVRFTRSK